MSEKEEYKKPVCKYCGREGLWFVGHTEICFKEQAFKMLKRIIELLEND